MANEAMNSDAKSNEIKMNGLRDEILQNLSENPQQFEKWTKLLKSLTNKDDSNYIRQAYRTFLKYYPYCYVYWKKWVNFEKEYSGYENVLFVFQSAINAFPLSVDIWISYFQFVMHNLSNKNGDHSSNSKNYSVQLIQIIKKGINRCGGEYRSEAFWSFTIGWLYNQINEKLISENHSKDLLEIYDELFQSPIMDIEKFFDNFKIFIRNFSFEKYLKENEMEEILAQFEREKHADNRIQKSSYIRRKVIEKRRSWMEASLAEIKLRITFENQIKRPYFHAKPLDNGQLFNWNHYLNWAIKNVSRRKCKILFERSLISCCLYEHFWIKYLEYLKTNRGKVEEIRSIFSRSCSIHLPQSKSLHFLWSLFEEDQGNYDRAIEIISKFEKKNPTIVEAVVFKANLYCRQNRIIDADQVYRMGLQQYSMKNVQLFQMISIKYSTFLRGIVRDEVKAVEVLENGIVENVPNVDIYMELIKIGLNQCPIDVIQISCLFNKALQESIDSEVSKSILEKKFQFEMQFGFDRKELEISLLNLHRLNP